MMKHRDTETTSTTTRTTEHVVALPPIRPKTLSYGSLLLAFVCVTLSLDATMAAASTTANPAPFLARRRRQQPQQEFPENDDWGWPTRSSSSLVRPRRRSDTTTARLVSSSVTTLPSPTAVPPPLDTTSVVAATTATPSNPNVVVQLWNYARNSVTRTVAGCRDLWRNYGQCQSIRAAQQAHQRQVQARWKQLGYYPTADQLAHPATKAQARKTVQMLDKQVAQLTGGISFEDFVFLQKGKEDRQRVLNLCFLVFGAPRFLPYALMFSPEMLPQPLRFPPNAGAAGGRVETTIQKLARQRTSALLTALVQLERDAREIPALSKFNLFGRGAQERAMWRRQDFNTATRRFLQQHGHSLTTTSTTTLAGGDDDDGTTSAMTRPSLEGAQSLLQQLEPHLYKSTTVPPHAAKKNKKNSGGWTRPELRLCHVPRAVTNGVANALLGPSLPTGWFHFLQRGRLLGHLQKIQAADEFLVTSRVDLQQLSTALLQETCQDRLLGVPGMSTREEMRDNLQDWLTLTVRQPAERQEQPPPPQQQQHQSTTGATSPEQQQQPAAEPRHEDYNSNLARVALLGYYGIQGLQDPRNTQAALPQLIFGSLGGRSDAIGGATPVSLSSSTSRLPASQPTVTVASRGAAAAGTPWAKWRGGDQQSCTITTAAGTPHTH